MVLELLRKKLPYQAADNERLPVFLIKHQYSVFKTFKSLNDLCLFVHPLTSVSVYSYSYALLTEPKSSIFSFTITLIAS